MFHNFHPVSITAKAAEEVKKIMQNKSIPVGYGLRLGVRGGGCGVSLMIGFDKRKETDNLYHSNGIEIFIDKKHTMYLIGKEVDFIETAESRGFTFVDTSPNH
jgi:iron-sulfur cluster assembly protein